MARDNPAARLHSLLIQFKQLPPDPPTLNSWAAVLDLPIDNLPELLDAAAALCALPNQVETALRTITDIDTDLFLEWKPKVAATLQNFTNMSGNSFLAVQQQYDSATLTSLAHAAHELGRGGTEIPADQLADLTQSVRELRGLVETSDGIEEALRQFLLDLVVEMERAVRLVRVRGVDGLEDAMEQAVGALVIRFGGKLPEAIEHKPIGEKLMTTILKFGAIVTVVNSSYQLGLAIDTSIKALNR
jgi:hypothetical protein